MSANLDVRTARSVLEGSCGVRGFDALASAYGWDFIESVMTPVVGDDPIAALEKRSKMRSGNCRQGGAAGASSRLRGGSWAPSVGGCERAA